MIKLGNPTAISMIARLVADLKPGVCDAPVE